MISLVLSLFLSIFAICAFTTRAGAEEVGPIVKPSQHRNVLEGLKSVVDDLVTTPADVRSVREIEEAVLRELSFTDEPMVSPELAPSQEPLSSPEHDLADRPPYKVTVLDPESNAPTSALILLHGLNGTVESLLPVVQLAKIALPNTRIVLPQAPTELDASSGNELRSWFDIRSLEALDEEVDSDIVSAAESIDRIAFLQEVELGIPRSKIALVGISQGGAVALTAYLRYEWGNVIGISTFLPLQSSYPEKATRASANVPLLMLHGTEDQLIPVRTARAAVKLMRSLERPVEYREFEGEGHGLENVISKVVLAVVAELHRYLM